MRRIGASVAIALFVAACGGGSAPTTASPPVAAATTVATTSPATTEAPQTTVATTTATTVAATTTAVETDIAIQGSDEFVGHTQNALALLQNQVAAMYDQAFTHIDLIKSVRAGSGMHVETKTFDVGDETAYAPGYELALQEVWYAGAIAHDSCHSRLYADGDPHRGKDAEVACLRDQLAAFEAMEGIEGTSHFVSYVEGLIDGADDPENQYWNDPNRHW